MEKAYYKQYYEFERNHWWFLARAEILEAYIKELGQKNLKILDAGTGTGANSKWLSNYGNVTSMEFDEDCISYSKNKNGLDYVQGSLLELPFQNESFDLVCAFDVIEHIENHELAVAEMKRVCKSGGRIFITVPAFQHLWSEHDEINHHFRRYTKENLNKLFENSNGEIAFSSYFNYRLYPIVLVARVIGKLFTSSKKKSNLKSDFDKFSPGITNNLLRAIFKGEKNQIRKKKTYPFGVSLILEWKKNN